MRCGRHLLIRLHTKSPHYFPPTLHVFKYSWLNSAHLTISELTKINTFYSEKLAEATRKIAALKSELTRQHELASGKGRRDTPGGGFLNTLQAGRSKRSAAAQNPTIRKLQDVKLAFSEYYLSLVLLQNYQSLNYTGKSWVIQRVQWLNPKSLL